MSAGSSNSNLGYGGHYPYVTKSPFVNATSSNNPATFGSNQRPTSCMKGGRKRKYNRTSLYKSMPRRLTKRTYRNRKGGKKTKSQRKSRRFFKGGYSQFQNNLPFTPSYSVAGTTLNAGNLALANPPPISPNKGGCVDNYNHFMKSGFPSRGH
jgi:hypothetical protein